MALQTLCAWAGKQLPATFSVRVDVAAIKGLHNAQCAHATFVKELNGTELAVVHEITAHGRAAMRTLEDDGWRQGQASRSVYASGNHPSMPLPSISSPHSG